jgi:hypothetical protein
VGALKQADADAATATITMLVRIAAAVRNVGDIEQDEWIIQAIETESEGRRRGYFPLAPSGSVPECAMIRSPDPASQCIECNALASFLAPGASVDCVVRFSMPATVRSGWLALRLDSGDETSTSFATGIPAFRIDDRRP